MAQSEFVPYVNINAKIADKPDQKVFAKYGLRGWPAVLLLDYDGTLLYGKQVPFRPNTAEQLEKALAKVRPLFLLRAKVAKLEGGEADAQRLRAELLLREAILKPKQMDYAEVEKAAAVKGLDATLVKEALDLGARVPFLRIYEKYEKQYYGAPNPREQRRARNRAKESTYALFKAGKVIQERNDDLHHRFWILAFDGAAEAQDVTLSEKALEVYAKSYRKSPAGRRQTEKMERTLESLKRKLAPKTP